MRTPRQTIAGRLKPAPADLRRRLLRSRLGDGRKFFCASIIGFRKTAPYLSPLASRSTCSSLFSGHRGSDFHIWPLCRPGHRSQSSRYDCERCPGGAIDVLREQMIRLASQGETALGVSFLVSLTISLWTADSGVKALFDALNIILPRGEAWFSQAQCRHAVGHAWHNYLHSAHASGRGRSSLE
jgi:hypothetical protein